MIVSRDGWVKRQKEVKDLVDHQAARGRRRAGGARRQHARDLRRSSRNFGVGLHRAGSSTCRRRPDTASRSRSSSS